MIDRFHHYILQHRLLAAGDRVLVGVSGGIDSMTLLDLFARSDWPVAVAHCNFGLRGGESDGDQRLVEQRCRQLGIPCHTARFDTRAEALAHGESTQIAARRLRYAFFEELCRSGGYTRVAIAHHGDDSVETFLINLLRGTGLRGLTGIPAVRGRIIRPLLFASREEILTYAAERGVASRNDSTNQQTHYLRNYLRHEVIPRLNTGGASFLQTMTENLERLAETQRFVDRQVETFRQSALKDGVLDPALLPAEDRPLLLFELLHPCGFSPEVVDDLVRALDTEQATGKQFVAPACRAVIDRQRILLEPLVAETLFEDEELAESDPRIEWLDSPPGSLETPPNVALLSADGLRFPLLLRRWRQGDWFIPLGMRGQKKVSDLLIDARVPLPEKERQQVLVSGQTIVWVVGRRIDDRYKVTDQTRRVIRVSV